MLTIAPFHKELLKEMLPHPVLTVGLPIGCGKHWVAFYWALAATGATNRRKKILPSQPILFIARREFHSQLKGLCDQLRIPSMICETLDQVKRFSKLRGTQREKRLPSQVYITSHMTTTATFGAVVCYGEIFGVNRKHWFLDHPTSQKRLLLLDSRQPVVMGINDRITSAQITGLDALFAAIR